MKSLTETINQAKLELITELNELKSISDKLIQAQALTSQIKELKTALSVSELDTTIKEAKDYLTWLLGEPKLSLKDFDTFTPEPKKPYLHLVKPTTYRQLQQAVKQLRDRGLTNSRLDVKKVELQAVISSTNLKAVGQ